MTPILLLKEENENYGREIFILTGFKCAK